jgi:hypothetical protein
MSNTKFTKGNWDWEHDESTSSMIQVDSDIGCSICRLQSENDAYLISAAPEMYKALNRFYEAFLNVDPSSDEANVLGNLLAKARGES